MGVMVRSRVEDPHNDMLVAMDNSSIAWYGSRLLDSLDGHCMHWAVCNPSAPTLYDRST
jgi:hypothetical protein